MKLEAAAQGCSSEKMFWKYEVNLQENTHTFFKILEWSKIYNIKRYKTQVLKRMGKSMLRNSLDEPNLTYIFFTQPAFALAGSSCLDFSFELRSFSFAFNDWGIISQAFGAKGERFSVPYKTVLFLFLSSIIS